MTHKHKTFKQNLERWIKPFHYSTKRYSPRQKLVTFKTLAQSKNIKSVINQAHKLDNQINYMLNKIAHGKMMGGLEVDKHGKPAMKRKDAIKYLNWTGD